MADTVNQQLPSGFTLDTKPTPAVSPIAPPSGFTIDQVIATADGFNITQSLLEPGQPNTPEALQRTVLAFGQGQEAESGFGLTVEGKRLFDEFQSQKRGERAARVEAKRGGVLERFGRAATEPFEQAEGLAFSAIEGLGLEAGEKEQQMNIVSRSARQLERAGIAVGAGALGTIASAVSVLGQVGEELTGAPREELVEAFDILTLFGGGAAQRLAKGPRLPARPVTEGERQISLAGRDLPVRTPLTQADVTQDINVQSFLDEAEQGIFGDRARGLAAGIKSEQDVALRANIEEIQRAAGGRQAALTPQEAGLGVDRASQALKISAGEGKRAIKDAYDAARTFDASIEGDLVKSFGQSARKRLIDDGFDVADSPKLSRRLSEIEDIPLSDGKLSAVTVNEIETWRKRVNKSIESVKVSDPSEAQALRTLKSDYDTFTTDLLDQGLIQGNTEAITAWKKARDLRADFGRRFESDAVIKKIVNEDLTQEESLNLIFGGSQMGFKPKSGAITRQIKNVLGEQSPEFKSLKEEAILRLVKNQSDSTTFSGAKFNTALEKSLKDNPTLMRELFTKEELIDLKKFARFSKTITDKKPGATNPSGTFNKLARMIQGSGISSNFATKFINLAFLPIEGLVVKPIREVRAAGRVERIINFGSDVNELRGDPELFRRALAVSVGAQAEQQ